MRRSWLIFTAALCVLLVLATFAASSRARRLDAVVESDGVRVLHRRAMGFIPTQTEVFDPKLHVSDDFKAECRRLGIVLPPQTLKRLPPVRRQWLTEFQDGYDLSGEIAMSPKDVVDAFAKCLKTPYRTGSTAFDQVTGAASDGRSTISVYANRSGVSTWVTVDLTVFHPTPKPRPTPP